MMTGIVFAFVVGALGLPATSDQSPVTFDHFPTPVHAFVWRNWQFVPVDRMADVVGGTVEDITRIGRAMGLGAPPEIGSEVPRRAYITIIRRNWHLLPFGQLTELLGMTEEQLAFTLREDDFLFIKLGSLKPKCPVLQYAPPEDRVLAREREIAAEVREWFPGGPAMLQEPLFQFVSELSTPLDAFSTRRESDLSPRFCSSYFALFGDPLVDEALDPFPDGYVQRLVASGVDSVWMHAVLYHLAPLPWETSLSVHHEERLVALDRLTRRLATQGIGVYLYLNEPRAMPTAFFERYPELKGVTEGDHAALCTAAPEVRQYLVDGVTTVVKAAPLLRGFFTITASENLTNCWSHGQGKACRRCAERGPAQTVADVNAAIREGIDAAGSDAELIAWDWGWRDDWALEAINKLPDKTSFMSVSEWSIPIERGGVRTTVGEYSISTIGPGPRAMRHWAAARERGLKTVAKIQAGNTWELAAVPYIPAVENVAQHAANLRDAKLDGIMLGWSLGGYPSPNLSVVAELSVGQVTVDEALQRVAVQRYGDVHADAVVRAWKTASAAFREFPYHGSVVYRAPLQVGPANPLWSQPTGYAASMVGIPYDDLAGWRSIYPEDIFIAQLEKVAGGFEQAYDELVRSVSSPLPESLRRELNVLEAAAIHFRSVAQQARYIQVRGDASEAGNEAREGLLRAERDLAIRLQGIQRRDSRIGYEASNHYFYVPLDLVEKVLNCNYLMK